MSTLDALQRTLAGEHAALYVYGVLGARSSQSATPALFTAVSAAYAEHRARRDVLTRDLRDRGAEPVASAATYQLPRRLATPEAVTAAALGLERRCAETYAYLVANSTGARRRWAVTALNEAAVRELAFRGTPETFPGAGEYADR
jgi:hypothetical protein